MRLFTAPIPSFFELFCKATYRTGGSHFVIPVLYFSREQPSQHGRDLQRAHKIHEASSQPLTGPFDICPTALGSCAVPLIRTLKTRKPKFHADGRGNIVRAAYASVVV